MDEKNTKCMLIVFYFIMYSKLISNYFTCIIQNDIFNYSNISLLPYKTNIAPF